MNQTNHLLACLIEECGEVAKEGCKSQRFGLDDQVTRDPNGPRGIEGPTNRDKIANEMLDLLGVYQMGVEAGIFNDIRLDALPPWILGKMGEKAKRVRAFMGYAQRVGALEGGLND